MIQEESYLKVADNTGAKEIHTIRVKAHDEKNEANVGDRVKIMETRPLSKDKRWRLLSIIEKAK